MTTSIKSRVRLATLCAASMFAAGCTSSYLDAKNQDIITPANINSVTGLPALYNGAKGDFAYANAGDQGNQEGQILTAGMLADEFLNSDTFPTRIEEDRRATRINNVTNEFVFRTIQHARVSADQAAAAYVKLVKDGSANTNLAEMYSLSSLATTAIAENYCSNVPLGNFTADSIIGGPGLTTSQLLTVAVAKADSALAAAPTSNLAAVAKGRALLDLGQYAAAAAAVATVPATFKYQELHGALPARVVNGVYSFSVESIRFSMGDNEGTNGLNFVSANDPRVGSQATGRNGFDRVTPQINPTKYPSRGAAINVADGTEAKLIIAESQLASGQAAAAVATLQALRDGSGLTFPDGPLVLQATPTAQVNQLFRERAFWLYATGHRLGDLRRLIRQYGRATESTFPTGAFHKLALTYGTAVSLPVPQAEQNNAQYVPASCDVTVP